MDNNNETKKDQIIDSIFQKEGEYIIDKFPKYKYEIKIVNDENENLDNEKSRIKSKTPNKIISSNFTILNNPIAKKSINNNNINTNNYITNSNNIKDNYDNNYNYNLHNSKFTKTKKAKKQYSNDSFFEQKASIININPEITDNCCECKKYNKFKKHYYEYCYNNENIENNKQCICEPEFDIFIYKCFCDREDIKKQYYNINTLDNRRNYQHKIHLKKRNPKFFKTPLRIEKSIEQTYESKSNSNSPINFQKVKNNINNNIYTDSSSSNRYTIINNKKYIYKKIYNKNDKYNNNKKENVEKQPKKIQKLPSNYSFVSIDDSKNNSFNIYSNSILTKKDKSQNNNNINNDDSSLLRNIKDVMIHKSSERKENIKSLPIGQKINPLVIKKSVNKPIVETIKKGDGTSMNVMMQTSVITSIETKLIKTKNSINSNLVKECITNIYTTLTKNLDGSKEKSLIRNKSFDNININKTKINRKKNGNKNKVFIKKRIADNKNKKQNNFNQPEDNLQEIKYDENHNNNIDNISKKNFRNYISEISNDLLRNNTINSSINNSSSISYEQIESNNNAIRISEEIKYIKYLYYRCSNLNSENKAKVQSLSNYFLKKSDEEKIGILTNLNDGNPENKKIYQKLINILREKRKEEENFMNDSNNILDEKIISDYEEPKKIKNIKTNILFKKKKIIK